jgi:hypothetical protein
MSHNLPFQLQHFDAYCNELQRVGVEPGYVMYTNRHASNGQPATRLVSSDQLHAAEAYINSPSDQTFIQLVTLGVLFDTEWDRNTQGWKLISFRGWEKLHNAFSHLLAKSDKTLIELVGLSSLDLNEIANNSF